MSLWLKSFWHKFFICCTYLPVIFKINGNTTWAYYLQKSNDELIFLKMNVSDLACCFCETIVVLYVCENMCGILEICYILGNILAIILVIGHHILGTFFFNSLCIYWYIICFCEKVDMCLRQFLCYVCVRVSVPSVFSISLWDHMLKHLYTCHWFDICKNERTTSVCDIF